MNISYSDVTSAISLVVEFPLVSACFCAAEFCFPSFSEELFCTAPRGEEEEAGTLCEEGR